MQRILGKLQCIVGLNGWWEFLLFAKLTVPCIVLTAGKVPAVRTAQGDREIVYLLKMLKLCHDNVASKYWALEWHYTCVEINKFYYVHDKVTKFIKDVCCPFIIIEILGVITRKYLPFCSGFIESIVCPWTAVAMLFTILKSAMNICISKLSQDLLKSMSFTSQASSYCQYQASFDYDLYLIVFHMYHYFIALIHRWVGLAEFHGNLCEVRSCAVPSFF